MKMKQSEDTYEGWMKRKQLAKKVKTEAMGTSRKELLTVKMEQRKMVQALIKKENQIELSRSTWWYVTFNPALTSLRRSETQIRLIQLSDAIKSMIVLLKLQGFIYISVSLSLIGPESPGNRNKV